MKREAMMAGGLSGRSNQKAQCISKNRWCNQMDWLIAFGGYITFQQPDLLSDVYVS